MKLAKLVNSKDALQRLVNNKIPISNAWDLKVFIEKANPEFVSFETLRIEKIKQYGEQTEDSGLFKVKDENFDVYIKELTEVLEKEIEIKTPVIKKDDLVKFKDQNGDPILISIEDLELLDYIIKE